MSSQEIFHAIALSKLKGLSLLNARTLLETLGSASEVFAHRQDIKSFIPDATPRLAEALSTVDEALRIAEEEMNFIEKKQLKVFTLTSDDYPQRLRECPDAPLVLYYYGKTDLHRSHVINVVGTRKCTEQGRELCQNFIAELKRYCPDVLIVSGLAYGIDICAHRAALENGIDTVGVLAHGLDTIYPSLHRPTAAQMIRQGGGLLTEYTTHTQPEKQNFVRRNRIVAGLCDATVIVESAVKGGSLITAELANGYSRDVFAFPGRIYDEQSAGCNKLIRLHQATLLTSAQDLVEAMGWPNPLAALQQPKAIQQDLFPNLGDEERAILRSLQQADDKHINQIVIDTNIPYSRTCMLLFELEMQGIVKALGGARYRLIRRKM